MKSTPATQFSVGSLVTNLKMEGWGPGKIFELSATTGTVHFRDLPAGSQVRKIGLSYLTVAPEQSDAALDLVALPNAKGAGGTKRKRAAPKKRAPAKVVEAPAEPETSEPSE